MSYQDLQIELKNTISEIKNVPKNTVPYILLKRKANDLHIKLLEIERSLAHFNRKCLFGNYENNNF